MKIGRCELGHARKESGVERRGLSRRDAITILEPQFQERGQRRQRGAEVDDGGRTAAECKTQILQTCCVNERRGRFDLDRVQVQRVEERQARDAVQLGGAQRQSRTRQSDAVQLVQCSSGGRKCSVRSGVGE